MQALHVGGGDDDALLAVVPDDLEGAVAEDGGVDLGVEVELGEVVVVPGGAEDRLDLGSAATGGGGVVGGRHDRAVVGDEVGRALLDEGAGVVEGQRALAAEGGRRAATALVVVEELAVAAHALEVAVEQLAGERELVARSGSAVGGGDRRDRGRGRHWQVLPSELRCACEFGGRWRSRPCCRTRKTVRRETRKRDGDLVDGELLLVAHAADLAVADVVEHRPRAARHVVAALRERAGEAGGEEIAAGVAVLEVLGERVLARRLGRPGRDDRRPLGDLVHLDDASVAGGSTVDHAATSV